MRKPPEETIVCNTIVKYGGNKETSVDQLDEY